MNKQQDKLKVGYGKKYEERYKKIKWKKNKENR